ncbi:tautomerase family protein [Burkholderia multivorans]|uniref:tautomerase family protein n=1 Tax=Burkholderia multivorans TaxID=87883 RepID=UPI001C23F6FD|nr:tautomerase family protein [Burkholderia multivorans]MBU9691261.1 tautomerase family protein [Burkholderia multivorans]
MPHVIVKLWPGQSEQKKQNLTDAIVKRLMATLNTSEDSVSVAIEEIQPQDWMEKVYRPDIEKHMAELYKKPGYEPF